MQGLDYFKFRKSDPEVGAAINERIYQELEPEKDVEFLALMGQFKIIENKIEQCEIDGREPIKAIRQDFDDIVYAKRKEFFKLDDPKRQRLSKSHSLD